MTVHRLSRRSAPRNRQQGAALIVSLILLLLMTIVGISSVRNTAMQERMAGNLRARTIAFERAERGLRAAEVEAAGIGDSLTFDNSSSNNGRYRGRWYEDAALAEPRWTELSSGYWKNDGTDNDGDGNWDYQYMLEQLDEVPRDASCAYDGSSGAVPACYLTMYLITVQADVPNTGATVVLQTTYKAPS